MNIVGGSYATCVDSPNDQSTTSGDIVLLLKEIWSKVRVHGVKQMDPRVCLFALEYIGIHGQISSTEGL